MARGGKHKGRFAGLGIIVNYPSIHSPTTYLNLLLYGEAGKHKLVASGEKRGNTSGKCESATDLRGVPLVLDLFAENGLRSMVDIRSTRSSPTTTYTLPDSPCFFFIKATPAA